MKTSVVILNYNTRDYLRQFLPGLIGSCKELDAQVVVADNASTDGSVAMMQAEFPQVPLIVLNRNYGFTGGYNRALEGIEAEYYVLINSDIEVPSGWLKPLVAWMDSHPSCGDRYGYPFCRGRVMQRIEKDNGQYDSPAEVLWASGACLMVRSGVWKALGGLDERFFAHMEEIDLCWRMQLRGWKVNIVPESFVYHIGGGTLPNESPFKLRLNFRNNLLLLENNLPATFVANGLPEARARRKTRRRILVRMCLDGLSALVYLLTRRWSFYQAVVQAHKEYRQLRRPGEIPASPTLPEGLYAGWIVPKGLFK